MLYCEGTQHTPQSSRDFPVSFASPGSGKSPTGFPGSLNAQKGVEEGFRKVPLGTVRFFLLFQRVGGQRRGAACDVLGKGPLSFWSPEGGQKNELKN